MIITRIVPALLVAAVTARALYIPSSPDQLEQRAVSDALKNALNALHTRDFDDVLYAREFEEFSELFERGSDQQMVRDVIANMKMPRDQRPTRAVRDALWKVLNGRDFDALGLRSEDVLSDVLVTRARSPSPSPGPYECKSKADCQQHIDYANKKIQEAEPIVAKLKREVRAAKDNKEQRRKAKNELDTAQGNLSNWEDHKEAYEKMKEHFRN